MASKTVQLFIPRGNINKHELFKMAIGLADLPPTLTAEATITSATRRPDDHEQPGTDFEITIDYTERGEGATLVAPAFPAGSWGGAVDSVDETGDEDDDEAEAPQ
ncbi:hypothetical protein NJBCHELONAE_48650 [Mycobacteroides chelonae]|uniref:hypothetical protein n=1 Tax=Mycobacteroides chelonae TaxID=1774 RepID=UPI0021DD25DE|nr:hypothetical protein [Mycobacteroides chelonae]GLE59552.1 hypothetical protein NJBCHELONAE_48650 [Mycobacteroides chelonae]